MIPRRFHLIWSGRRFPYVNRLAVESILLANPRADVVIHFSDPPSNEHWQALETLERVSFRELSMDELLEGAPNPDGIRRTFAAVAENYPAGRSNIWRYLVLNRFGGIYVDFDVLALRSMEPLLDEEGFVGEELVFKADDERVQGAPFRASMIPEYATFLASWALTRLNSRLPGDGAAIDALSESLSSVWGVRKLNNAVLGAEAGHPFFRRALELIPETDPAIRYGLGPILMNRVWAETGGARMRRLGPEAFYAVPPSQTHRFFSRGGKPLPEEAYLIHWCSSNEKKKAAKLTPETLDRDPGERGLLIHRLAWKTISGRDALERG